MSQPTGNQPSEPSDDLSSDGLEFVDLETVARQPPSQRKRLVQGSLVLVVLVVTIVAFWRLLPRQPQAVIRTPTPSLYVRPFAEMIESSVSYGTITINGQRQPMPPPFVRTVSEDTEDITLDTPPFQRKTCHLSNLLSGAPRALGDCQVDLSPIDINANNTTYIADFAITFPLTISDLPPDMQGDTLATIMQAATARQGIMVPRGSYFAASIDQRGVTTGERATSSLQASALFAPKLPPFPSENICPNNQLYCFLPAQPGDFPAQAEPFWAVYVNVGLRWRFTTSAGTVVSDVQFPTTILIKVILRYDSSAGWQVFQQQGSAETGFTPIITQMLSDVCATGLMALESLLTSPQNWGDSLLNDAGIEGCAMQLQINGKDAGEFVWRFGVLLAANAQAHTTLPTLPIAPSDEIAAVGG